MKHRIKILTVILAVLLCLGALPGTRADAADSYRVKETRVDDVVYYSVYSNTEESNENHFYTTAYDVYDSAGAFSCTLTFYEPLQPVDVGQADALAKYLAGQMRTKGYVNWYSFSRYGETFYWVYGIEGWDPGESVYNLEDAGPWSNMAGESCSATVIGRGNQNAAGYSTVVWFPQSSPKDGMTVGFSFSSGDQGGTVRKYCLD